eukprot:15099493-Alexandrium_andersonii.AAC.1
MSWISSLDLFERYYSTVELQMGGGGGCLEVLTFTVTWASVGVGELSERSCAFSLVQGGARRFMDAHGRGSSGPRHNASLLKDTSLIESMVHGKAVPGKLPVGSEKSL